ncbi:thioredoxin family protein [Candidatus Mycoplasma pogonae]
MVKDVVKADLANEKMSEGVVLLTFHATWCGPCKMLAPVLDELAKKHPGLAIYKVDIDKDRQFAIESHVEGTPTTFVFHKGQPVQKVVGYAGIEKFEEIVKPYL